MNVYPAAGLIHYLQPNVPIVVIDPKPITLFTSHPLFTIQKPASSGILEAEEIIKKTML
jgi:NAD-dependent deacetylase